MAAIYFITGTDTGVGKTVLTSLLVRHLREQGTNALAVKPFCSGGREDARLLRLAQNKEVTLDEINPWHFRAPLAPLLAARCEGRALHRDEALAFIRKTSKRCRCLLVEGAGGLLSPLGDGFDAQDLILELNATPLIVCPNRLGVVNQARLVLAALPSRFARRAQVVLMAPAAHSSATRSNAALLAEFLIPGQLLEFPRVDWPVVLTKSRVPKAVAEALRRWRRQN